MREDICLNKIIEQSIKIDLIHDPLGCVPCNGYNYKCSVYETAEQYIREIEIKNNQNDLYQQNNKRRI